MVVARFLAGRVVRRHWRATVFLALLTSLAGGLAIGALSAGRRTATAYERMLEFANPPELLLTFCPPDMAIETEFDLETCFTYPAVEERRVIERVRDVEAVGKAQFSALLVARAGGLGLTSSERWLAGSALVEGTTSPSLEGRPLLVDGRWYDDGADDEVVVNERLIELTGLRVGDEIVVNFWGAGEIQTIPDPGETFNGPTVEARIVGVARGILDLAASGSGETSSVEEAEVLGGSAFAERTRDSVGYGGLVVDIAHGASMESVVESIEAEFPGRPFNVTPSLLDSDTEPIEEAISYEARSVTGFGLVAVIAAAVVIGQSVARQTRREWADAATLSAIGVSDLELRLASTLRMALTGVLGSIGAAAAAIAVSPLGPIGVARLAEVDPGVAVDAPVVAAGMVVVLLFVAGIGWATTSLLRSARSPERTGRPLTSRLLPPSAVAGLRLGHRGGRSVAVGTAYLSVAAAVAFVVAAAALVASLDRLVSSPEEYGAPWDLSVVNQGPVGADGETAAIGSLLASSPDVARAAGIVGTDVQVGEDLLWVHALMPLDGKRRIAPVITDGREPVGADEVALGEISMRELGVDIGDTINVTGTTVRDSFELMVVGEAVVNDTYEVSPGRGGIGTLELITKVSPELTAGDPMDDVDPYVLDLEPGVDADAFVAAMERRAPVDVSQPTPSGAIRNVQRIERLPVVLAASVAVLALASLVHALVLAVRRSRPQLGIWSALGLTPGQTRTAVAWYASMIAGAAILVGVPAGLVLGRLGWRTVARQVGVPSQPVVPLSWTLLAIAGTFVAANLVAAYPGWRAARAAPADALRTE